MQNHEHLELQKAGVKDRALCFLKLLLLFCVAFMESWKWIRDTILGTIHVQWEIFMIHIAL